MKKNIIFCLPFAGGNKYSYRSFQEYKYPNFELIFLEYPGRGGRSGEPLLNNIDLLVEDIYNQIKKYSSGSNYVIYGHSLGGLLAYLLSKKIQSEKINPPKHLFVSGTSGPSSPSRGQKKWYTLQKDDFFKEVINLNGCPAEVLNNSEMLEYLEPILRADFEMSETYKYCDNGPIDTSITVITGTHEDLKEEDIRLWERETTNSIEFFKLPGDHFFIFNHPKTILDIIFRKLHKP
jgi:surfactin synthase thioesterase subunit